jgi:uncharacterized protein (TIGR03437 family)
MPDPGYYIAERPSVSGDGVVVAYTAATGCNGGSHCIDFRYFAGFIANPDGSDRAIGNADGVATLSRNGRYALLFDYDNTASYHPALVDLSQNLTTFPGIYRVIGDGRQNVADSGVALLSPGTLHDVGLLKDGTFQKLDLPTTPDHARLDASAQVVVYESAKELHSFAVASGRDLLLRQAAPAAQPPTEPALGVFARTYAPPLFRASLSSDGRLVSYILDGQLWVQFIDGSGARQLTFAAEGINDAVLSGSGAIAYAATNTSRLLRIDVASGAIDELLPSVPTLAIVWGALTPGSRVDVSVDGAPEGADPELLIPNAPAPPIIARSDGVVTFQVPWEASVGSSVPFRIANPSPLEQLPPSDLSVFSSVPAFFTRIVPSRYAPVAIAAHEDFHGPVTDEDPAVLGEVIHLYFTGLGAVSPPLATGVPTPIGALYRIQAPLTCQFITSSDKSWPGEILFAGLAPGFIGVYQVDMRIPSPNFSRQLRCSTELQYLPNTLAALLPGVVDVPIQFPNYPGI